MKMAIVKNDSDVFKAEVEMEGAHLCTMQILIGPDDGSQNIIMRRFELGNGGHTPLHTHNFEHVVKIMEGKGIIKDHNGVDHPVEPGMCAFVPGNLEHQFLNTGDEPFAFLCIILNPDKTGVVSIH